MAPNMATLDAMPQERRKDWRPETENGRLWISLAPHATNVFQDGHGRVDAT